MQPPRVHAEQRRVRPFDVVITPFQLYRFTVTVLATISTSWRARREGKGLLMTEASVL